MILFWTLMSWLVEGGWGWGTERDQIKGRRRKGECVYLLLRGAILEAGDK